MKRMIYHIKFNRKLPITQYIYIVSENFATLAWCEQNYHTGHKLYMNAFVIIIVKNNSCSSYATK